MIGSSADDVTVVLAGVVARFLPSGGGFSLHSFRVDVGSLCGDGRSTSFNVGSGGFPRLPNLLEDFWRFMFRGTLLPLLRP